MSARIWKELGLLENVKLEINNLGDEQTRTSYSEALVKFLKNQKDELDEDTQRKLIENPLRILDSKSKTVQDLLDKAPSIEDFINEDSKKFNMKFLEILETHGIEYEVNPKLVRGLDYYNQTVFEWKTDLLGSQDTILGGGRYDNLVEELGGKSCPAIGFSIGLERLILLLKDRDKINIESNLDIYFICFSQSSAEEAIMYSEKLKNKFPSLRIKTNLGLESASSQFKKADKSGAKIALILGEEELDSKKISFKDLRTKSNQESLTFDELINKLEI